MGRLRKLALRALGVGVALALAVPSSAAESSAVPKGPARAFVAALRADPGLSARHPALKDIDVRKTAERRRLLPVFERLPGAGGAPAADFAGLAQDGTLRTIVAQAESDVRRERDELVALASARRIDPVAAGRALSRIKHFRLYYSSYLEPSDEVTLEAAAFRIRRTLELQRAGALPAGQEIPPEPRGPPAKGERILAVDALRGLTIMGMIYVNESPAIAYRFLQHSPWHGCTPADVVFPLFLLIMGASVALALGPAVKAETPHAEVMRHVGLRASIIFALGVIESYALRGATGGFQLLGVLQSIAFCYVVSSLFFLKTRARTQALAAAGILAGYWLLLAHVPAPGSGKGILTAAGNLSTYVDKLVLGRLLHTHSFAPESLLGLIPKVASSLFGLLAGRWLQARRPMTLKAAGLFAAGAAAIALGLLWTRLSLPFNKHLWTSSYALFAGGLSLVALAATCWVVDIRKYIAWTMPYAMLGRNSLAAYFLSGLLYEAQKWIPMRLQDGSMGNLLGWFLQFLTPWFSPHNAALVYTTCYFLAFLGFFAVLPGKKYLKV